MTDQTDDRRDDPPLEYEVAAIRAALMALFFALAETQPAILRTAIFQMRDTARTLRKGGNSGVAACMMALVTDMEDLLPPPDAPDGS